MTSSPDEKIMKPYLRKLLREHRARDRDERASRLRKDQPPAFSGKKRRAELLLEQLEVPARCRLCDVHHTGRRAERALLDDLDEEADAIRIHNKLL